MKSKIKKVFLKKEIVGIIKKWKMENKLTILCKKCIMKKKIVETGLQICNQNRAIGRQEDTICKKESK